MKVKVLPFRTVEYKGTTYRPDFVFEVEEEDKLEFFIEAKLVKPLVRKFIPPVKKVEREKETRITSKVKAFIKK